jgi:hypothetical protein
MFSLEGILENAVAEDRFAATLAAIGPMRPADLLRDEAATPACRGEHDEVDGYWPPSNNPAGFCADCNKPGIWPKHLDQTPDCNKPVEDGGEDCSGRPHWEIKSLCVECRVPRLCECSRCWENRRPIDKPFRKPVESWTNRCGITYTRVPFEASDFPAERCAGCRLLRPRAPYTPQDRLVCSANCHTHYCSLKCLEKDAEAHDCYGNETGRDVMVYYTEMHHQIAEGKVYEATEVFLAAKEEYRAANAVLEHAEQHLTEWHGGVAHREATMRDRMVRATMLAREDEAIARREATMRDRMVRATMDEAIARKKQLEDTMAEQKLLRKHLDDAMTEDEAIARKKLREDAERKVYEATEVFVAVNEEYRAATFRLQRGRSLRRQRYSWL